MGYIFMISQPIWMVDVGYIIVYIIIYKCIILRKDEMWPNTK